MKDDEGFFVPYPAMPEGHDGEHLCLRVSIDLATGEQQSYWYPGPNMPENIDDWIPYP